MEQKTFIKAMREHFGYRQGATLNDFSKEIQALNQKDREDFKQMFKEIGIEIIETPQTMAPQSEKAN